MKKTFLLFLFFNLLYSLFSASPGDIIITEYMANPAAVADDEGEYVELYNTTGINIDINGWTLRDDDFDSHLINNGGPLIVPAGGFCVLGKGDGSYNSRNYEIVEQQDPYLMINEVDSDTPGVDNVEFIELYDFGVGNFALDGYVIVLFNGNDDLSYTPVFDLDGYSTDANGYFLIGNAAVPGVDIVAPDGFLQNGPDAVALYYDDGINFPNDTPITLTNLIDAIVYDTNDPDDPALLVLLLPGQPQVNEGEAGTGTYISNQRIPNGTGGRRCTDTYAQIPPTPGSENLLPPPRVNNEHEEELNSRSWDFSLANTGDEIVLEDNTRAIICSTYYASVTSGRSKELDNINNHVNGLTLPANYYNSTTPLTGNDYGSPGSFGDTELPVTLSSFTATVISSQLLTVSWLTESESNMSHFSLYRDDLMIFTAIASNSTNTTVYTFNDEEIEEGSTYNYLLEAVENDMTTTLYGPLTVAVTAEDPEIPDLPDFMNAVRNFPNPFNPSTIINFMIPEGETGRLEIFDEKGRKLAAKEYEEGEHFYFWDASKYGSGVYFYRIESASYQATRKMLMIK